MADLLDSKIEDKEDMISLAKEFAKTDEIKSERLKNLIANTNAAKQEDSRECNDSKVDGEVDSR